MKPGTGGETIAEIGIPHAIAEFFLRCVSAAQQGFYVVRAGEAGR